MRIGILSDTHNEFDRTLLAVDMLREAGAEALFHCGDLNSPPIVEMCSAVPFYFTFGNHDSDSVPALKQAAIVHGATCLGWGGTVELVGRRIGLTHGHMRSDVQRTLADSPGFLFFGHSHFPSDETVGSTRRINPGALHRADEYTVALLDLDTGRLELLKLPIPTMDDA
jgi:uncharacterized protein